MKKKIQGSSLVDPQVKKETLNVQLTKSELLSFFSLIARAMSAYIPQHAKDCKLLNYTVYNKGKELGVVTEISAIRKSLSRFTKLNYLCEVSKSSVVLKG